MESMNHLLSNFLGRPKRVSVKQDAKMAAQGYPRIANRLTKTCLVRESGSRQTVYYHQ